MKVQRHKQTGVISMIVKKDTSGSKFGKTLQNYSQEKKNEEFASDLKKERAINTNLNHQEHGKWKQEGRKLVRAD